MSRGILAVFGPMNQLVSNTLLTFTNFYNLPYLTWSNEPLNMLKSQTSRYQIFMQPDIGPALVSLIKHSQWDSIYYIYNYEEGNLKRF